MRGLSRVQPALSAPLERLARLGERPHLDPNRIHARRPVAESDVDAGNDGERHEHPACGRDREMADPC